MLGPGKDGKDLRPDGLQGAAMTLEQRALFVDLAGAWVRILHETSAKPRMEQIKADIKERFFPSGDKWREMVWSRAEQTIAWAVKGMHGQ